MTANLHDFEAARGGSGALRRSNVGIFLGTTVLAAALLASACSSTPNPSPDAVVIAQLGAGTSAGNGPTVCQVATGSPWIQIGTDDTHPITSGSKQNGGEVTVSCTVHSTGGGNYTVSLSALLAGQGSINVVNATIPSGTTTPAPMVQATFESGSTGDFTESDCTFDFGGQMGDIASAAPAGFSFGIAPGRIWGNLICPMIVDGENSETCFAAAELRFENCAE
jgi:hypothetical protein